MSTELRGMDELDALTRVCEMRAILAKAGRWDLADLAWNELCPTGVPIRVRHAALVQAGYVAKDHPSMAGYREALKS